MKPKTYAVILAAGSGERMGFSTPKQFLKLAGKTVIEHTLAAFDSHPDIDEIFIVVGAKERLYLEELLLKSPFDKVTKILNGGSSRKDSSFAGIQAAGDDDAYILMHDAVRPFVSRRIISQVVEALGKYPAVDVAIPATDTIIEVDRQDFITEIPDRAHLRRGQTPQGFRVGVIRKAHLLSQSDPECTVTDDCKLILRYDLGDIYVVPGEEKNIKVTYPEDLFLADKIFQINTAAVDNGVPLRRLKDKVVVVFGASKGIGKAVMDLGAEHGARMFGFSRSSGVDVAEAEAVERALAQVAEQAGRVDMVANTAGVLRSGRLTARDDADIRSEIEVNYLGSINTVKAALPHLEKTRGSIALFTSSSFTRGRSLYTVYSSTKAALVNLVQGVAEEVHPLGVRINAINPERTATPMRVENFGPEPPESLLTAEAVAEVTLKTLLSAFTGTVVDVRRKTAFPESDAVRMSHEQIKQLALINRAVPKDPRRVLFVGRADGQFGGNAKYLFLHMVAQAPDLNPVYLTSVPGTHRELRAAGLPCTLFPEGGSLKAAASAGVVVVDDFHYKTSPLAVLTAGARVVQLWHGVGFKKIGFLEAESGLDLTEERRAELRTLYSGYQAVISTSPFYTEHLFSTSFGAEEIWETGYPRNDVFFRRPTKHDLLGSDPALYGELSRLARTKAVFAYLPTFRDATGDFLSRKALDMHALDKALGAMNAVMVFKMHNYEGDLVGKGFTNLRFMASGADIYPLLPLTTGLITDYSSIYTDYLCMDKPVAFHCWDLEEYQARNRELQFDYDWITPGPKCRTQAELTRALAEMAQGGDLGFTDRRREIGQLAFAEHDGQASARALGHIRELVRSLAGQDPAKAPSTEHPQPLQPRS